MGNDKANPRQKLQSLNPSTGELLAELEPATEAGVRDAVARAAAASGDWRKLGIPTRIR